MSSEVAIFLAHAIALEAEAAERYDELAGAMEVHNNPDVAALFHKLAGYSKLHLADVQKQAEGIPLPHLKPWEFEWSATGSPEAAPIEKTHYLMKPYHCIQLALQNERRGHAYYADIAYKSQDPQVRRLAGEFAAEEAEHVAILEKWASTVQEPDADWDQDLDPPVDNE
jgi:rubrerythrin